ncbi:MAG: AAA family ATPase [Betaproteobacteria bacterium]|nr:AAA family ATPase [Betaproteobacteria bacterium]
MVFDMPTNNFLLSLTGDRENIAQSLAAQYGLTRIGMKSLFLPYEHTQKHLAGITQTERASPFSLTPNDLQNIALPKPEKPKSLRSRKKPFARCVRIFEPRACEAVVERFQNAERDVKKRVESKIQKALMHDGYRQLPDSRHFLKKKEHLVRTFENFSAVLEHLTGEFIYASCCRPEEFLITPMLLDGPPGVGKTAFAQKFAATLDMPYIKIAAGGLQHAATINGTSSHWGNSHPGAVFEAIAHAKSSSCVILLDEVDKISTWDDHQILPALLDLLEPESARQFKDESLELTFDASRVIVLLTSNDLTYVNNALLSRCKVFPIELPEYAQRLLIGQDTHDRMNRSLTARYRIELNRAALETLAAAPISIRTLIHVIRQAFHQALAKGIRESRPEAPQTVSRPFGFI